jgi:hypothetical protein
MNSPQQTTPVANLALKYSRVMANAADTYVMPWRRSNIRRNRPIRAGVSRAQRYAHIATTSGGWTGQRDSNVSGTQQG